MESNPLRSPSPLRRDLLSACDRLLMQLEPFSLPEQRDQLLQYRHALHNEQLDLTLLAELIKNVIYEILYILAQKRAIYSLTPLHLDSLVRHKRHLELYPLLQQLNEWQLKSLTCIVEARCALTSLLENMLAYFSFEMNTSVKQWSQKYTGEPVYFNDVSQAYLQQEDEIMQFLHNLTIWFANCFQQEFNRWLTEVLQPLLQTKMVAMGHTLEEPLQQFFATLTRLQELMCDGDTSLLEYTDVAWDMGEWQVVMNKIEQRKIAEIIAYTEDKAKSAWYDMLAPAYLFTENFSAQGQPLERDERLLKAMLVRHYQRIIEVDHKKWTRYTAARVDDGLRVLQEMFDNYLCMCADSINALVLEVFDVMEMSRTGCEMVKTDVERAIEQFQALYDEVDSRLKEAE